MAVKRRQQFLQSPCLSPEGRQDVDTGLAVAIPILPTTRRLSPEEQQEQRRWFVRMVARRAVAILKAKEEGK